MTIRALALRAIEAETAARSALVGADEYYAADAAAIDARETFLAALRVNAGIEPELWDKLTKEGIL